jgi:hypothetical protein
MGEHPVFLQSAKCICKFRHAGMTQIPTNVFKMFLSYIFCDILWTFFIENGLMGQLRSPAVLIWGNSSFPPPPAPPAFPLLM